MRCGPSPLCEFYAYFSVFGRHLANFTCHSIENVCNVQSQHCFSFLRRRFGRIKQTKQWNVDSAEELGKRQFQIGLGSNASNATRGRLKKATKAKKGQKRRRSMRFDPSVGGNDPFAGNPRRICEARLSSDSSFVCFYICSKSALYVFLLQSWPCFYIWRSSSLSGWLHTASLCTRHEALELGGGGCGNVAALKESTQAGLANERQASFGIWHQ